MVLAKGKRFIKKVPPSGVAPVFKLTLPHSVVHAHMHHLVDAEFDIATSTSAPQTWHGRISPRRNKSRSEYTLQGWRLFAEALGVRAGDQVSFELVNRRRLVVRIIKPGDGRPLEAESPLRTPSPSTGTESPRGQGRHSSQVEGPPQVSTEDDSPWSNFTSACAFAAAHDSGLPTFSGAQGQRIFDSHDRAAPLDNNCELWQGDMLPPALPLIHREAAGKTTCQPASEPYDSATNFLMHLADSTADPLLQLPPGAVDDTIGGLLHGKEPSVDSGEDRSASGAELDMQLFSLNTMLRRLQDEARDYHERAVKAEADVAKMKATLRKLRENADAHTRGMLRAGSGIEAAVRRLQAPEFLAHSAETSDVALAIRSEVMQYHDMLKACIWSLLNAGS